MTWKEAAQHGDLAALSSYLAAQSHSDTANFIASFTEKGTLLTPLHYASQAGRVDAVRLLLDNSPPQAKDATDLFNRTPLYLSVLHQHPAVTRLLLQRNADANIICQCGTSPVSKAAEHGDKRTLSLLLGAGAACNTANADGETPRELASRNGHDIPWARHEKAQREKLKRAAARGDTEQVRLLVQAGVNPAERTPAGAASPLEVACEGGRTVVVRFLLHEMVPPFLVPSLSPKMRIEAFGPRALHEAAKKGHEPLVELLLDTGFPPDARDADQMTPLHRAAAQGHTGAAELLLRRDAAGVLARGVNAVTPLHQAATQGKADMVGFLLDRNADPEAEDGQGMTPKDRARGDAIRVFEQRGL